MFLARNKVTASAGILTRSLSLSSSKWEATKIVEEEKLPSHAKVVIAGGGMIGNSVAFHLVKQGWTDIIVIEKGEVAAGQSRHGSGMLGLFRPHYERKIVQYCIDLYQSLEDEGYDLGLKKTGSVNFATTRDRFISLKRRASAYRPTGMECHIVGPKEMLELNPYLNTADVLGGVWIPNDACVDAGKVSEVLAHIANKGGAKFKSKCGVRKVHVNRSGTFLSKLSVYENSSKNVKVTGVETDLGFISCDYFVNCAGIWAREIGKMMDIPVRVPVCAAEHFFLTFKPIVELQGKSLPSIRDYDSHAYLRQQGSSFLMGVFERNARPWDVKRHGTDPDWNVIKEEHWLHMEPYIRSMLHRLPILRETQYDYLLNTPDAFTPDGRWILGEAPEVGNYFVCAGMNGNSLQGAGGVGKAVADWIVAGSPTGDMLQFEVQRFTALHNNQCFLQERAREVVARHYDLQYPIVTAEFKYGRRIRSSPIYSELEARGAIFGERMGWERALYFDPNHHREDPPAVLPPGTFRKPDFMDHVEDEYHVCREGVGLIDMSSFAKFIIRGEQNSVVNYLQQLCSNDINIPVAGIVPTGMQNESGGYENDCMLIRRDLNSFFMVSPTQQQTRILEWMENHLPKDNSVGLQDVTSMYTVLSIAGPKSKILMDEMTGTDMTMHPFTYKEMNVGYASGVMVLALTNTGEPGYSLYIPSEFALQIYDNLMKVGRDYGIRNVGQLAMRFLRIEKFIPFWGEELNAETTPFEVNRTFKVKLEKESFIGRDALLRQKEQGVHKRLVQFHLEDFNKDEDLWPWGEEAIYRDGEFVGFTTTTAYGFTIGKMIALGMVQHPQTRAGNPTPLSTNWLTDKKAKWTIDIAGTQVPVSAHIHPPSMPVITQDFGNRPPPSSPSKKPTSNVELLKKV